jgi:hypothetical protein
LVKPRIRILSHNKTARRRERSTSHLWLDAARMAKLLTRDVDTLARLQRDIERILLGSSTADVVLCSLAQSLEHRSYVCQTVPTL